MKYNKVPLPMRWEKGFEPACPAYRQAGDGQGFNYLFYNDFISAFIMLSVHRNIIISLIFM
jgi:hypothetical protein